MVSPAVRASSAMFRQRTGFAPVCMTCASSTRLRSSWVESATTTTTSGAAISSASAMRSSGENELRL